MTNYEYFIVTEEHIRGMCGKIFTSRTKTHIT